MREILTETCRRLNRRRGRALLTVGGIFVGVLMVTLVSVIGGAGTTAVSGELEDMGLQGVSVSTVAPGAGLTPEDLATVRHVSGVTDALPLLLESATATLSQHHFAAYAGGIDAGADQIISLETAYGRLFHAGDIRAAAEVCVVDEGVARAAYGRDNVVGKTLTLTVEGTSVPLRIIGVAKADSSLLQTVSGYLPGLVYLPYTTLQTLCGKERFTQIAVRVTSETEADSVRERIVTALERETGFSGAFTAKNLAAQRDRLSRLMDIVSWILTAVSGISLVVAGMGVMTSMLTAVSERVREIGIKQALGATRRRILAEFLVESILLSAFGATIGVGLGVLAGAAGLALFGVNAALPWGRFAVVWGFTVLLGGVFGWYPAKKAAALHPAQALHAND